ncbi:unnamed protein product [Arabidopsis halleri]
MGSWCLLVDFVAVVWGVFWFDSSLILGLWKRSKRLVAALLLFNVYKPTVLLGCGLRFVCPSFAFPRSICFLAQPLAPFGLVPF